MAKVPLDFMDGQPLRYVLQKSGRFLLYSVGSDARDDGGDAIPATDDAPADPWNGRDWVWPRLALS